MLRQQRHAWNPWAGGSLEQHRANNTSITFLIRFLVSRLVSTGPFSACPAVVVVTVIVTVAILCHLASSPATVRKRALLKHMADGGISAAGQISPTTWPTGSFPRRAMSCQKAKVVSPAASAATKHVT